MGSNVQKVLAKYWYVIIPFSVIGFSEVFYFINFGDEPESISSVAQEKRASLFAFTDSEGIERFLVLVNPGPFVLASGPRAYVYSTQGKLLDWSLDIGDSSGFLEKWNAVRNRREVQVDEAEVIFEAVSGSSVETGAVKKY
jgi:hypothetical protein